MPNASISEAPLAMWHDVKLVVDMKSDMKSAASDARRHEAVRLVADEPNRLAAYRLETDLIESLNRAYYFAKRMARAELRAAQLDRAHRPERRHR